MRTMLLIFLLSLGGGLSSAQAEWIPVESLRQKDIRLVCGGHNGPIQTSHSSSVGIENSGGRLTLKLESDEGQLLVFRQGQLMTDVLRVVVTMNNRWCDAKINRDGIGTWKDRVMALSCSARKRELPLESDPPVDITVVHHDGSKFSFAMQEFDFHLTQLTSTRTSSVNSDKNSVEVNIETNAGMRQRIQNEAGFLVFKGHGFNCLQ